VAKHKKGKRRTAPGADVKEQWLADHGPYEFCMMRYCFSRLYSASDQLDYNAHFECFASKARVLVDFLDNRGKQSNDIRAVDFTSSYSPPSTEPVKNIINKLSPHAAHASTQRPKTTDEKISREDSAKLAEWIEQAMEKFLTSLDPETRPLWADNKAGSRSFILSAGSSSPTASSADPIFSSFSLSGGGDLNR